MPQPSFTPAALAECLDQLFAEPTVLAEAAAQAATQGRPDAAAKLADVVEAAVAKSPVGERTA